MCVQIIDQGQQIQIGETRSVCSNSVRVEQVNTNLLPGPVNTNWGPGPVITNLGPGAGVKQRAEGRGPGNTNTQNLTSI